MTMNIEDMKRQAKRIARATTVTHAQALDVLAVQHGFTHWGPFAASLSGPKADPVPPRRPANPALVPSVRAMLQKMLSLELPHLEGCRHLVVTGATSTGKTTLVSDLLDQIGSQMLIAVVEDVRELRLPDGALSCMVSRTDHHRTEAQAIINAMSMIPDLLVVGEMSYGGAAPIVGVMAMENGPTVVTTVHATTVEDAKVEIRKRVDHSGQGGCTLPAGVAMIQMERAGDGTRRIARISRN